MNAFVYYANNKICYSSLHNRVSKILRLNAGFVFKLTVFYFTGISKNRSQNFLLKKLQAMMELAR
ncbi:hypothetical protein BUQ74_12140 [Leptospira weilii serovar Heyan]|nr:hypothetical protein BUQ74_12140 [Leptospira weilii serovar Heyan]